MINQENAIAHCETDQLVVFRLANEFYGVDIGAVNTIIRMQDITEIPRTPDWLEGVINLRGSIVPVIDLRKRFRLPKGEISKTSRIIVVETQKNVVGMIVDEVVETLHLPKNQIEPPSSIAVSVDADYMCGIGKTEDRLVILLNLDKIISKKDSETLSDIRSNEESKAKAA